MINDNEYIRESIESNLIYNGSMLEFAYSLSFSFLEYNKDIIDEINNYYDRFRILMNRTIEIANNNISKEFLNSDILYTKYTIPSYKLGEELTSNKGDINIIENLMKLTPGIPKENPELLEKVNSINKNTLNLMNEYKDFITYLANNVLKVNIFVFKYAMYIYDIKNRLTFYINNLKRIIKKEKVSTILISSSINDTKILMERNALFINGFVNQSEEEIILEARRFAEEYNKLDLLNTDTKNKKEVEKLYNEAYNLTNRFSNFIISLIQKLLDRKLQLMVGPAYLDICLRETNDFKYNLKLLQS